ncbi:hypothetical protein BD779DRAFT_1392531, partial [Infundibulicybe gibba]
LIGNALEIPTQAAWITYAKWAETYGNLPSLTIPTGKVIHAEALGQHIIILSSLEDVIEIMEKRASNYSSRPPL